MNEPYPIPFHSLVGEYATLWSNAAVKIPTELDAAEAAPLLCAGVTVFNGIRNMNVTAGDIVAIQGLGGLGHLAVQYSRKLGYNTVAISSSDSKKDFATKLGANHYIDTSKEDPAEALQKLGGASLVVITAPNPDIMGKMVNGCGPLGKVLILARKSNKQYFLFSVLFPFFRSTLSQYSMVSLLLTKS